MLQKIRNKKLYLFYILILLFWSTVSAKTSASEMAVIFCGVQEYYVNHPCAAITPLGHTFPSLEYLSARNFDAQETMSAAKGRQIKPFQRFVRNVSIALFSGGLSFDTSAFARRFTGQEIPSHRFCGIIITNYIHNQDGQKV